MSDRLYRSRDDRMLAGVAGGLAEIWGADPSVVRVIWALLVFLTGGVALVVYIVMAIVVPEADSFASTWPAASPSGSSSPAPVESAAGAQAPGGGSASVAAAGAPPAWTPGPSANGARDAARAARREAQAARRAARAQRGGFAGSAVLGLILVALGAYFLARQWLPDFDFGWFWPLALVGVGVVLLASAFTRRPDDPGGAA